MKLNTTMTIASVLSMVFGLAFLFIPAQLMMIYGINLDTAGEWMGRYVGTAFVSIGLLNWYARNAKDGSLRAILIGDFSVSLIGVVVTILAFLSGLGNALVWSTIAVYLLLTIGFGYFLFAKQGAEHSQPISSSQLSKQL